MAAIPLSIPIQGLSTRFVVHTHQNLPVFCFGRLISEEENTFRFIGYCCTPPFASEIQECFLLLHVADSVDEQKYNRIIGASQDSTRVGLSSERDFSLESPLLLWSQLQLLCCFCVMDGFIPGISCSAIGCRIDFVAEHHVLGGGLKIVQAVRETSGETNAMSSVFWGYILGQNGFGSREIIVRGAFRAEQECSHKLWCWILESLTERQREKFLFAESKSSQLDETRNSTGMSNLEEKLANPREACSDVIAAQVELVSFAATIREGLEVYQQSDAIYIPESRVAHLNQVLDDAMVIAEQGKNVMLD